MQDKKGILFIGEPLSVHDIKWMDSVATSDDFRVFLVCERPTGVGLDNEKHRLTGMPVTLLGSVPSFSASRPLRTLKAVRQLRDWIKANRITLINCLFATPHALWTLFLPQPSIITTRGSDALIVLPSLQSGSFREKLLFRIFTLAFRNASAVTTTSVAQSIKLQKLFPGLSAPHVIRTGVSVEEIARAMPAEVPEGRRLIFSPRWFSPVYNIELQLEAIGLLSANILDQLHFVFISGKHVEESYALSIRQNLAQLKHDKEISYEVMEELSQKDMFSLYKSAALTVMTPLSDGTPNSGLEAMAAGCPLIIPPLPYDPVLFNTDTCFILPDRDPISLAMLMTTILSQDNSEIINAAFSAVKMFGNRDVEMKKLLDLYSNILAKL